MIDGDIDLTENLDFRKDKPDQYDSNKYELVPWKDGEVSDIIEISINDDYIFNHISTTTYTTTISYTNTSPLLYNSYTNSNTGGSGINMLTNGNPVSYTFTYNYNDILSSFTAYDNSHSLQSYNNHDDIWITTNYNNNTIVKYVQTDHVEKDIFGYDRKKKAEGKIIPICSVCNKLGHEYCNPYYDSIQSSSDIIKALGGRNRYIIIDDNYIPWDDKELLHEKKEKRSIPWLRNLINRIYDDYIKDLFEEQDYTSYLTNYTWLRL